MAGYRPSHLGNTKRQAFPMRIGRLEQMVENSSEDSRFPDPVSDKPHLDRTPRSFKGVSDANVLTCLIGRIAIMGTIIKDA